MGRYSRRLPNQKLRPGGYSKRSAAAHAENQPLAGWLNRLALGRGRPFDHEERLSQDLGLPRFVDVESGPGGELDVHSADRWEVGVKSFEPPLTFDRERLTPTKVWLHHKSWTKIAPSTGN